MKLTSIIAGQFKLDGGAMFGVVPRRMWEKLNPPDENHLCTWSLRCLLVETEGRKILIDTGVGEKQDARFRSHFQPSGELSVRRSLESMNVDRGEISDVFLTHFHFDHVGGAVERNADDQLVPTFPNAKYWSCKSHYEWALNPNARERASFLKENFVPLFERGVLHFIEEKQDIAWTEYIRIKFCYGHTHAMMVPIINTGNHRIAFCADLLPSSFHVRMPYVMAYDVRPLETLREKKAFFEEAIEDNYVLFLEHDPVSEAIRLSRNEKGRYEVGMRLTLDELD